MPRVTLALVFGATLYLAASAVAAMSEFAQSYWAQASCLAIVGVLHATTGYLAILDKAGTQPRTSRETIVPAALSAMSAIVGIATAMAATAIRPLHMASETAALLFGLAVGIALTCTAIAVWQTRSRSARGSQNIGLHRG